MRHRVKKRLSLLILLVGLPLYIAVASTVMTWLSLPKWAEMLGYVLLGLLWAFPFKQVFLGVGQADPDARDSDR